MTSSKSSRERPKTKIFRNLSFPLSSSPSPSPSPPSPPSAAAFYSSTGPHEVDRPPLPGVDQVAQRHPTSASTPPTWPLAKSVEVETDGDVVKERKVPARRKSRMRLLSSFLPALIIPDPTDIPPSRPIHRKPVPLGSPISSEVDLTDSQLYIRQTSEEPVIWSGGSPSPVPPSAVPAKDASNTGRKAASRKKSFTLSLISKTSNGAPELPLPAGAPRVPELTETLASPRFEKARNFKPRSSSLQPPPEAALRRLRGESPSPSPPPIPESRRRSASARPRPPQDSHPNTPRAVSNAAAPRPASGYSSDDAHSPQHASDRGRLRRSWMPGGRSRSVSKDLTGSRSAAWIMAPEKTADYSTAFLVDGEKVPELWNENGTVFVYLYPKSSGRGPSFKVPPFTVSCSPVLEELMESERSPASNRSSAATRNSGGQDSLSMTDTARSSSPPVSLPSLADDESHLYLHSSETNIDLDRLVAVRNLFAFLTGQPLVATKAHPTVLAAFQQIASLLHEYDFSSQDGVSWGETVDMSLGFYVDQLGLADVRHSREKTLEALIIGEQMRSWHLYYEAFTHAVGKYSAIVHLKSPLFEQLSVQTRQRLERASIDLINRRNNVNLRLDSFDFPSLFSGVANSTSNPNFKHVGFRSWKSSFARMRSFTQSYYKNLFGNWPPKAKSKKNHFSENGLNRQVLKVLYADLCMLYDMLVDRESITTRVIDQTETGESASPSITAFRKLLQEFDTSSPPVLPPIPFDIPKIPTMASVLETYDTLSSKEQGRFDKRLQMNELLLILHKSYNFDMDNQEIPFLTEFKDFEAKEGRGKSASELADARIGYWLFLYVVLQSLPMLVIDAPDLQFTEGVEYFLCEPPLGNPPWVEDAGEVRKMWYEVAGGQSIVELSADVVMFSVEATYYRSHCWMAAKAWDGTSDEPLSPLQPGLSPLKPPPAVFEDLGAVGSPPPMAGPSTPPPMGSPSLKPVRPRILSPGPGRALHLAQHAHDRSSIAMGLQPLPFGADGGIPGDRTSRTLSSLGPSRPGSSAGRRSSSGNLAAIAAAAHSDATFDDILKGMDGQKDKPKKKFF